MKNKRHAGLTFSGNKTTLAVPYQIHADLGQTDKCNTIFLHIPKCGGTTLHFIMECCSKYSGTTYARCVIRKYNPPVYIRSGWTGAWDDAIEYLNSIDAPPTHLSGHFPFGIHKHISRDCKYITLLRDPVQREISSFNHHYQKGFHTGDVSLLVNAIKTRAVLDNPQVRMLAGVECMTGECTEETYNKAISNLSSSFMLVGTVEKYNEFLQSLLALNNWPAVAYVRAQVSAIKSINKVDDWTNELIDDYHSFDRRVYEYAIDEWDTWKEATQLSERVLSKMDPVIYLPPDIHENRRPYIVRAEQLDGYTKWSSNSQDMPDQL